ncbi:MAG: hypothetical protein RBU37_27390, partial [Myxococcota bacterium]|nr:hypothetical protein [Myxococcota bacterium]
NRFGDFDPFGVMFAADALARLGRAEDAPKVEAKLAELKATRDAKLVAIFEMYLKPLRFTLLAKTQ